MFWRRWIFLVFTLVPTGWFGSPTIAAETQQKPVQRRALLVGVGKYEGLTQAEQLFGCANDVALMRDLLASRFGFAPQDVVSLVDGAATGAAIRSALARLVNQVAAAPADEPFEIVFHFSGHGSQVEDQPVGHPDHDEEDGLDESFVPADSTLADGTTDRDLRDDELYRFLETICKRSGVRVWVVLDCCHSGTGARGTRFRRLNRGLPMKPVASESLPAKRTQLPPGAVCLSACRADELEPEFDDGTKTYGLLTRFLAQSLESRAEVSRLNYERLRQLLSTTYRTSALALDAPEPQWEGEPTTLENVVLRATSAADRSPEIAIAPLDKATGRVSLAAGAFQGVTRGAVYRVAFDGGPNTQAVAPTMACIEDVTATESTAVLFQENDADKRSIAWPIDVAVARALLHAPGPQPAGLRFRVARAEAVDRDGHSLKVDEPGLTALLRAIADARRPGEIDWLTWSTDSDADLLVRIDGRYAAIFPSIGRMRVAPNPDSRYPASLQGGWGPVDLQAEDAASKFLDLFRRIARARNLIRVSEALAAMNSSATSTGVQIELVAVKLDERFNITGAQPWTVATDGSQRMHDGAIYAFRLTNKTSAEAHVTLLTVDPNLGIEVVIPDLQRAGAAQRQRLAPGEVRLSDPFQCDEAVGTRYAILLATPEPNELWYVAQEKLPTVRSTRSPLADAIFEQTHFRSRGENAATPTANAAAVRVLRWEGLGKP